MKEIAITGKHYRVLGSVLNKIWYKISLWTAAKDVEFKDGTTLEEKYNEIQTVLDLSKWVEDTTHKVFTYTLSVDKVADKHPYISLIPYESDALYPSVGEMEAYGYITAVKVEEHELIFYALKKPTVNINVDIIGVIKS